MKITKTHAFFAFLFSGFCSAIVAQEAGLTIESMADEVKISLAGRYVTTYHTANTNRPFFYPLIGPSGASVTRHWPMKDGVKGEEEDHPHHQSLWFTHGDVNGIDFWSNPDHKNPMAKGQIRHDGFEQLISNAQRATLVSTNSWVSMEGELVCTDRRTHVFKDLGEGQMAIDFTVEIFASEGEVVFGDTKEGSMAVRLAPSLRAKGKVAKGKMVNSEGGEGKDIWGKRAGWVSFFGPDANGETVGVAIFESPKNPRYPTWWHARDYGLLAANPFGVSYFEDKERGAGELTLLKGESLKLSYRIMVHRGTPTEAKLAEHFSKFSAALSE